MGVALAAVTDGQDLLALDQVHVGIAIIVDTHYGHSSWQCIACKRRGLLDNPTDKNQCGIPRNRMPALRLIAPHPSLQHWLSMSPFRSALALLIAVPLAAGCSNPDPAAPV